MNTFKYSNSANDRLEYYKLIREYANGLGIKNVTHWDDEEMQTLKNILGHVRNSHKLTIAEEGLYSLFPQFHLKPMEDAMVARKEDMFGCFSMTPTQFLLRPNIKNITSCHTIVPGSEGSIAGNLRYMANPFWSCIAFYQKGASQATPDMRIVNTQAGQYDNPVITAMPNILATCNAMVAYDLTGTPSLFLSSVYGDSSIIYRHRFLEWWHHNMGGNIYAAHSQASYWARDRIEVSNTEVAIRTPWVNAMLGISKNDNDSTPTIQIAPSQDVGLPFHRNGDSTKFSEHLIGRQITTIAGRGVDISRCHSKYAATINMVDSDAFCDVWKDAKYSYPETSQTL